MEFSVHRCYQILELIFLRKVKERWLIKWGSDCIYKILWFSLQVLPLNQTLNSWVFFPFINVHKIHTHRDTIVLTEKKLEKSILLIAYGCIHAFFTDSQLPSSDWNSYLFYAFCYTIIHRRFSKNKGKNQQEIWNISTLRNTSRIYSNRMFIL